MSHYERWNEEEAKQGTLKCFIAAVIVTLGMLCLLIFGLAWMSTAEKVSAEIYGAKYMENQIKSLEDWRTGFSVEYGMKQVEYENHTHRYHDGHIK